MGYSRRAESRRYSGPHGSRPKTSVSVEKQVNTLVHKDVKLPATWDVPEEFRNRLGKHIGRQRSMCEDGHILLVLHAPPLPDEDRRHGRFFWRKADGTWVSDQLGDGPGAVMKHLKEYDQRLDELENMEDDAKQAEDHFIILESLSPLHRTIRNMHAVMQDLRKRFPEVRELINMRDQAYDLERTAELLAAATKNSLEYKIARSAEEQAAASDRMAVSAHRLNMLVAFFFPLATITTVFGMEIRSGLEKLPQPQTFFAVIAIGLLMGAFLMLYVRVTNRES